MKELVNLLGKHNLTKRKICDVVIQTAEPDSIREYIEQVIKILDSAYANIDLYNVAESSVRMNSEQSEKLLGRLNKFEGLFDTSL